MVFLFSADAFGCFGALNGAIFADEVDFEQNYMDEARRYYANIIGKYGTQVQAILKNRTFRDSFVMPITWVCLRKSIETYVEV